jgi:hypothetical protein
MKHQKITIWRVFLLKTKKFFCHPPRVYPPTYTRRAHATTLACTTRWYTPSCDAIFAPARPLTRRRAVPGLLGWNNALAGVDGAGSRTEKERARGRRGSSSFFFLVALGHGFCGSTLGRWSRSAAAAAAVAAHPNSGGLRYITSTAPSWHPPLMDPPSFPGAVPTPSLDARFPVPSPPSYTRFRCQHTPFSCYLVHHLYSIKMSCWSSENTTRFILLCLHWLPGLVFAYSVYL